MLFERRLFSKNFYKGIAGKTCACTVPEPLHRDGSGVWVELLLLKGVFYFLAGVVLLAFLAVYWLCQGQRLLNELIVGGREAYLYHLPFVDREPDLLRAYAFMCVHVVRAHVYDKCFVSSVKFIFPFCWLSIFFY